MSGITVRLSGPHDECSGREIEDVSGAQIMVSRDGGAFVERESAVQPHIERNDKDQAILVVDLSAGDVGNAEFLVVEALMPRALPSRAIVEVHQED